MTSRTLTLGVGLLVLAALSSPARADWPSSRQNPQRTGTTKTVGNLENPAPFWRYFLGGTLAASGLLATDVDGDGASELILASGDGLAAKRPTNGDAVWTNGELAFGALDGLADLDGDGTDELVAHTSTRAFVLRVADGKTLWAEERGEMGTLAAVRIGDLDGDGASDLVIHECGCCSINSGKSAVAYRFAGGSATLASPALLWTPPTPYCGGSNAATLAAMRAPNALDFVFGTHDHLELRDGKTGSVVASMPPFGVAVQSSRCNPLDVDGDGRDELLCVLIDASGTPNNGRRAYLVKYEDAPAPRLRVVWEALVGTEDGNVRIPPSFLGDLDGDGALEFVLGGKNALGAWSTYVFGARDGLLRATVDGQLPSGLATLAGTTRKVLLTDQQGSLTGWGLAPTPGGSLGALWTLEGVSATATIDYAGGQRSALGSRLATFDVDGDGTEELLTTTAGGGGLAAYHVTETHADLVGSFVTPSNVSLLGAWSFGVGKTHALAVAQSDGNAHLLDAHLAPVSGQATFGARFGGFYASAQFRLLANHPVLGELGDGVPGLLVETSRGALERLDATHATFATPPTARWSRARTLAAQIGKGLGPGGQAAIVAVEKHPGASDHVVALDRDGALLWDREVSGVVLADLALGNLDGDSASDVVVEHGDAGDTIDRVTALSGATGAVLWNADPVGPGNRQPAGGSLVDWNGDGRDDYIFEYEHTRILDGVSGGLLADSALGGSYYMPMPADVDGDGALELTLYAGYTPAATLTHGLDAYLWQGKADDRPLTYGALVSCPQGVTLLGGSWSTPARLSRIVAGGPQAGTTSTQILASGGSYADVAAAGANAMGQLASPAVHANFAGDSVAVAAVGSGDGWLYGVEACSGALRFSRHIGAPVGAVLFGATEAEGAADTMLASAADGYLYAFRNTALDAVGAVKDLDPANDDVLVDVDDVSTEDTLSAAWTPVSGADGYDVAVVRAAIDGGALVAQNDPNTAGGTTFWRGVGPVTEASLTGLALEDGHRYHVAVRARRTHPFAVSPDASSDGVVVHRRSSTGAGESGGPTAAPVWLTGRSCVYACAASGRSDGSGAAWVTLVMAALGLRRRGSNRLPRGR